MGDPIDYTIVRNLQAALQAMTTASGYHFDVASLAVKLDPNQDVEALLAPDGPRPFVVLELKPDTWSYSPANETRIVLPCTIHWVSDSTPTEDESWLLTYLQGCADVERAIAADHSRGGLAIDTRILKRTYDTAVGGAQVWAIIDVEISLRRTYGAPDAA